MNRKQFWTLFTIIYLGIGLIFTAIFEQGTITASYGQGEFYPKERMAKIVLWPITGLDYIIRGFPNNYSAIKK